MGEPYRDEDLLDLRVLRVLVKLGVFYRCFEWGGLEGIAVGCKAHMFGEEGTVHLDGVLLPHGPVHLRGEHEVVVGDPLPLPLDGRGKGDARGDDLADQV